MSLVIKTSFIGDFDISQTNDDTTDFDDTITKIEKKYLRLLLGDDLYLLLIADLDSETPKVPQNAPYIKLVAGENYKIGTRTYIYEGLLNMLRYFIFSEWKIIKLSSDTNTGTVRKLKDESELLSKYDVETVSNEAFNKAVDLYYSASNYIFENQSDFSTWYFTDVRKRGHFMLNTLL